MELKKLQFKLGHNFKNIKLLELALMHKSANNQSNNERLEYLGCLLYTSPSPRDRTRSRMPSSA